MAAAKSQHVVPRGGFWAVRKSGSDRATRVFDTQEDAISAGRKIARKQGTELYIHDRDGLIRARESFVEGVLVSKG
jgi:hypothetical protein